MADIARNLRPRKRPAAYAGAPLTLTWAEAAGELRATERWLRDHIADLPGFPVPDPLLDVFAREAIEQWVRRRFGLVTESATVADNEAILLGRINGQSARALPGRP